MNSEVLWIPSKSFWRSSPFRTSKVTDMRALIAHDVLRSSTGPQKCNSGVPHPLFSEWGISSYWLGDTSKQRSLRGTLVQNKNQTQVFSLSFGSWIPRPLTIIRNLAIPTPMRKIAYNNNWSLGVRLPHSDLMGPKICPVILHITRYNFIPMLGEILWYSSRTGLPQTPSLSMHSF